jgi:hypothetical protein
VQIGAFAGSDLVERAISLVFAPLVGELSALMSSDEQRAELLHGVW